MALAAPKPQQNQLRQSAGNSSSGSRVNALINAGFDWEANALKVVSSDKEVWEQYARATFEAHASIYPPGKLRFMQYVTKSTREWWTARREKGALPLGRLHSEVAS